MKNYTCITNWKPVNSNIGKKPKYFKGKNGIRFDSHEILNHARICKKTDNKKTFIDFYIEVLGEGNRSMLEKAYEEGVI